MKHIQTISLCRLTLHPSWTSRSYAFYGIDYSLQWITIFVAKSNSILFKQNFFSKWATTPYNFNSIKKKKLWYNCESELDLRCLFLLLVTLTQVMHFTVFIIVSNVLLFLPWRNDIFQVENLLQSGKISSWKIKISWNISK